MKKFNALAFRPSLFVALICVYGSVVFAAYMLREEAAGQIFVNNNYAVTLIGLGFLISAWIVLEGLHILTLSIINALHLTTITRRRFQQFQILTFSIFLLQGLILAGARLNLAMILFLLVFFVLAQLALLWLAADRPQKEQWLGSPTALPLLFFISGFSALIYQIVWQRVLFATFGTNIESVTVIVSVFMFGLGIGALVGGQVQKYFSNRLLECFITIEMAIGLFGIFSIGFIHAIGRIAPHNSLPALIGTTYLLLAFPTMMMGSTLPVLVGYMRKRFTSVGVMVGQLYAYNTFGSALAAFLTVMLLFTMMGQQATLILAAGCNVLTACLVWFVNRQKPLQTKTIAEINGEKKKSQGRIPAKAVYLLSIVIGFASLSLEIIWMRVLGFMTGNRPQMFGLLLAIFLGGIAYGSIKARRWSEAGKDPQDFISRVLLKLAVLAFLSVPAIGLASSQFSMRAGVAISYILVGFGAYYSGGIFPLLCQLGVTTRGKQTGITVSKLYFLNIIGATAGSLITGFVLFDIFPLGDNIVIVCVMIILMWLSVQRRFSISVWGIGASALALVVLLQPFLYANIISRLQGFPSGLDLKYVNENRHGIITVSEDKDSDIVYGNGVYDGRFNIDPANDSNMIGRVVSAHPRLTANLRCDSSYG